MNIIARYKCYKCDYKYDGKPGLQPPCPKCGSLYIDWLNYKEFEVDTGEVKHGNY